MERIGSLVLLAVLEDGVPKEEKSKNVIKNYKKYKNTFNKKSGRKEKRREVGEAALAKVREEENLIEIEAKKEWIKNKHL